MPLRLSATGQKKIPKGVIVPLLLALAAIALSYWVTPEPHPASTAQPQLKGLEWQANNTRIWSIDSDSQQLQIQASKITSEKNSKRLNFSDLHITQQTVDQLNSIQANTGTLSNSQYLTLSGQVYLQQIQPTIKTIETQKLNIDLQRQIAQTSAAIKLSDSQSITTAKGLLYSSKTGELTLKSDIKTQIISTPEN